MSPPQELQDLPIDLIEPSLSQPRRYFDEGALEALAASVGERGVLQPVLVRPLQDGKYQLVAGERRWRAAQLAGLQTIPALISSYDDLAALEVGLIENMAREDLNPVEEARACATLVQELGLTYRELGERVGRGSVSVWDLIHLLDLSDEILELVERGELSAGHARALLSVKDPLVRSQLANAAIEGEWTMRVLEERARESNIDQPKSRDGHAEDPEQEQEQDAGQAQERDAEQEPDPTVMNVAKVWGDLLGVKVSVRTLGSRKVRLEVEFTSAEVALTVGGHLAEQVARAKKRR
jgi:ParB family transcriptional regulator, chromosome partitioning protein